MLSVRNPPACESSLLSHTVIAIILCMVSLSPCSLVSTLKSKWAFEVETYSTCFTLHRTQRASHDNLNFYLSSTIWSLIYIKITSKSLWIPPKRMLALALTYLSTGPWAVSTAEPCPFPCLMVPCLVSHILCFPWPQKAVQPVYVLASCTGHWAVSETLVLCVVCSL